MRRYRPEIVAASWVTHWIDGAGPLPESGGNPRGVRQHLILAKGVTCAMLGNLQAHGHKPILRLPHEEYALPFLRSRSVEPELDRVFVWRGG